MIKSYYGSLYGEFRTRTFSDIYDNFEDFNADYNDIGIPVTISVDSITTLFYLLYANYGNSHIASSDETRFKYKLFSLIWQYGPTWEKEVFIQKRLRDLTESEMLEGSKQLYNMAQNPGVEPSTGTSEELNYINSQNVIKNKKSLLEGYATLSELLKKDVTSSFLTKFRPLFLTIVEPELPLLYENIGED